ncbi:amino acid adenylation domain-containing protein [Lentzea fradiae]|uniref:Amino acid adenylation domain-containing protein n=1 Tax=Lentzea fradiae TaxID=200378 RepID=A0A1G8BDP1_9PSEU|nr:non-ribosomal peptide synthetase [Lentzea fradiae]SDH31319.1 amino acid adenylation domain-containing protein [Lentzea fradiae]
MTSAAEERRALAELLLREQLAAERAEAGIRRRPDPRDPVPLSPAQQRIWLVERLNPGTGLHNELVAVRLRGPFDAGRIAPCVAEVVRRHEALRTAFTTVGGEPVQVVTDEVVPDVRVESVTHLPADARESAAHGMVRESATRLFDLSRPPLLRVLVVALADDDHLLAVTAHHVVSDGWSIRIVLNELMAHYRGGPRPADPPVQFADYAVWQREQLESGALAGQLDYWRQRLGGAPPELELPADRERPHVPTHRGGEHTFTVPAATVAALTRLARDANATVFMVLVAAFQALLARYSGQDDIVVGTPTAGRPRTETEGVVGCFINPVALRVSLEGDPAFRELLDRVRTAVLGAFAHQDVPFEQVVEQAQARRQPGLNPLYQVMITLHNTPLDVRAPAGVRAELVPGLGGHAKLDLTLGLVEERGGLTGHLEYSTDLFDHGTAERLAGHFTTLLDGVAADPGRRLGDLPLLTADERAALLAGWTRPITTPEPERCLHEIVAEHARATPDAVAVVDGDRRIGYAELDARAERLAAWLRSLGVRRGTPVVLCLPRGAEQVIAILGVLKAGGAYVPVAADDPAERVRLVLESTGAPLLLTTTALLEGISRTPVPVLAVEATPAEVDAPPAERGDPADLAYVFHTSGSTGRPKGVQIEHRNVVRLVRDLGELYGISAHDTWSMFHYYGFDVSVWEMFGALLHGGRLVLVPQNAVHFPEALHRLLAAEGVTVLSQTPTAFAGLIAADRSSAQRLDRLRLLVLGGERLDFRLLADWYERYPADAPLVANLYGPTETTIWVTHRAMSPADTGSARSFLGGPLPSGRLLVADDRLEPVPTGVPGELIIAGPLVGRGYLDRPEEQRLRFVPDPHVPGRLCYRSGDLVRLTANGDLEFLRRIDDQVKVRGFRIELGEVEVALRAHPDVVDAVAAVHRDDDGSASLVAYVVSTSVPPPGARDLRAFLADRLPGYLVPSRIGHLDRVPATASGKVDRRSLPPIAAERRDHVPPANAIEAVLAEAWSRLLGAERVSVVDNVFELGAHSLLALRLHRMVRDELPGFDAIDIFQHPTVRGLAEHVTSAPATAHLDEARERAARRKWAREDRRGSEEGQR